MDSPPRVLIIDDNRGLCQAWQSLLGMQGFAARSAGTWLEAMQSLETEPPDAVVLDLMLPDFDGFEILGWLRRSPKFRELPVVVCSALGAGENVERARKAGAADVLAKPCRPTDLADALRRVVKSPR